jgi:hypothetical protein
MMCTRTVHVTLTKESTLQLMNFTKLNHMRTAPVGRGVDGIDAMA